MNVVDGSALYVQGHAEDTSVEWLIDSGCGPTLLSMKCFAKMKSQPRLQPCKGALTSVDGSPIKVYGEADIEVHLGTLRRRHPVIVADILNDGLVGCELLQQHHLTINFSKSTITGENGTAVACTVGTPSAFKGVAAVARAPQENHN